MQTTGFMDLTECSTAFNFISVNTYDLGEKRVFKKEKTPYTTNLQ